MPSRAISSYKASLASKVDRHDDVIEALNSIIVSGDDLNDEEKKLLSSAYSSKVASLRNAWRTISTSEGELQTRESPDVDELVKSTRQYRDTIEQELTNICQEVIKMLEEYLIRASSTQEAKVFYLKMKADYLRYSAEFGHSNTRKEFAETSLIAYKLASDLAITHLKPTNTIRLALALNFSVFYYEILNSTDSACTLAKRAFDEAMEELDTLNENDYAETSAVLRAIRENLGLWAKEAV